MKLNAFWMPCFKISMALAMGYNETFHQSSDSRQSDNMAII